MKKVAFIKRSNGKHWVGDGFPVRNIFSYNDIAEEMSPFLLMDYAGPTNFPATNKKLGVGQHPHRGFETVTIVYKGGVSHQDSSGGGGSIGPGDVQWMTAASGVLHEEFHSPEFAATGGDFEMVQLWVNLPAKDKMSHPGYQGILNNDIPEVSLPNDVGTLRLIAGEYNALRGPAKTFTPMNVWDIRAKANAKIVFELPEGHTSALFVLEGSLKVSEAHNVISAELVVMERSDTKLVITAEKDTKFLLLSGEPINEPIVGQGPFVMNSRQEIMQAVTDFQSGRFGKIERTIN
ncbi:pirin family protein [Rosenbergiella australiborealis]|uniref:Pirin family protein n=1 Tax=Rosenbergiella australiborealis TaxID=1544696 RepID=A0ABS5T907_9GAMM|nr:pirin family protein [Rosenbergiella australiborealis]MBT0727922.1 pirin family protein [Rosenbergiella australiborealis]